MYVINFQGMYLDVSGEFPQLCSASLCLRLNVRPTQR
jgi:hypothetical protein